MGCYVSEIGEDEIEHFDAEDEYKNLWYKFIKVKPLIGLFVEDQLSVVAIVHATKNVPAIECLQIHTVKETKESANFARLVEEHYNVCVRISIKMQLLYSYCKGLGFVDVAYGYIGKNIGAINAVGTIKPAIDVELFEIFKEWYKEGVITYAMWQLMCKKIKIGDNYKILECEYGSAAVVYDNNTETVYVEALKVTTNRLKLIETAIGSFDKDKYKAVFINVPADWDDAKEYLNSIKFGLVQNFLSSFFEKGAR